MSTLRLGSGRNVYGLTVYGLDHVPELTTSAASDGPVVRVTSVERVPDAPCLLDDRNSVAWFGPAHQWVLRRAEGTAELVGPPLSPELLAHPGLAPVATVFNRWAGRESFHAAAFVIGGRAYGVIGPREAGKSTLTAGMAARGVTVLADDVVITDGRVAFAGPRCVDLRTPIPGLEQRVVSARLGTRWRVPLPPTKVAFPLGGWVFLRWGERVTLSESTPRHTLARLAQWRGRSVLHTDPEVMLDLATTSAWDLCRPKNWAAHDRSIELLIATLAADAARRVPSAA